MISNTEYLTRRQALVAQLPKNAIVIIPSAVESIRSNDTEYLFRQDSYFWYFTGFNEPDACLVLINDRDGTTERDEARFQDIMFCRERDLDAEIWHGRRIGVDSANGPRNTKSLPIESLSDTLLSSLMDVTWSILH